MAMRAIAWIAAKVNDISGAIAAAVEQQTATTNEIGRNVQEAAKASNEITHSIQSVARTSREAAQGARETQKAAQLLTELSTNMQRILSGFRF